MGRGSFAFSLLLKEFSYSRRRFLRLRSADLGKAKAHGDASSGMFINIVCLQGATMNLVPNSWQELAAALKTIIDGDWATQFPDPPYVDMIVKRVFFYYSRKGNAPTDLAGWERATTSFLSEDWRDHKAKKEAFTRPYSPTTGGKVPYKPPTTREEYVGRMGGSTSSSQEFCTLCHDLGVVRLTSSDFSHETLGKCSCYDPDRHSDYQLPAWIPEIESRYFRDGCPTKWFKPQPTEDVAEISTLNEKIFDWRLKVSQAEAFWRTARTNPGNKC